MDNWITLDFPAAPTERAVDPGPLAEALGVPVVSAWANRFDLIAEVESDAALRAMTPDIGKVAALPARGVAATARSADPAFDFVSRFFAPAVGIAEDPVTGSAHCGLGPYWAGVLGRSELVGYQASGRGGVVRVRVEGDRVCLGGRAVTVLRGRAGGRGLIGIFGEKFNHQGSRPAYNSPIWPTHKALSGPRSAGAARLRRAGLALPGQPSRQGEPRPAGNAETEREPTQGDFTMSEAVFKRMSEVKPEEVRWLWDGRIPLGKVTLLEGQPGVGKSTLALDIAARVSRGTPLPLMRGSEIPPSNVVIFSGDDALADTVRPRLEAAEADLERIYAVDREFDLGDVATIKPALIVLDTLSSYLNLCVEDNLADVVRKLGMLAKSTGAAVLAVFNTDDRAGEDPSPDFYGTPRSVLEITPVGHGGRRLSTSKSNLRHITDVHPLVYYIQDANGPVHLVNWSDGR